SKSTSMHIESKICVQIVEGTPIRLRVEGKKVLEGQSIDHRLDVSTLSPGIYLLKVQVGMQSQSLKLVKT
ncbi:MAG: T9SS type A sorting domain-containing protein, partial [Bacteroidota bacterium]